MARLVVLLCLGAAACELTIEIEAPPYESELVIQSLVAPDSAWQAYVTRSLPIGDLNDRNTDFFLDDVDVTILDGDRPVDQLLPVAGREGWYSSPTGEKPIPSVTYRIEVAAPGLMTASAEAAIPMPPQLSGATVERIVRDYHRLHVTIRDMPDASYYHLSAIAAFTTDSGEVELDADSAEVRLALEDRTLHCTYSDATRLFEPGDLDSGGNRYCQALITADRLFENQSKTFEVDIRMESSRVDPAQPTHVQVVVRALTTDYVDFKASLEDHGSLDDYFREPLPIFTNVKNGLGVFAGYATAAVMLPLQD